jgi:ABC-2 type transport system ATP-binding protein
LEATAELHQVSKFYESKAAVRDLNLRIEPGAMFGLLGPNGAGKTSTIRMIVGITMPDSGSVHLFGRPFERRSLEQVGYLPEERGLYKRMKVADQLALMGQLHGLDGQAARTRAQHWCERLAIAETLQKRTQELSKGMQQKIQFIATILHQPRFLILDEPFSGLDPVNAALIEQILMEMRREGCAILFSTHRMDQVEKLCDRICMVDRGEAVLSGTMREVKSRYPRDRVLLEFEGDDAFLRDPAVGRWLADAKSYGRHAELKLHPGADTRQLLSAIAERTQVYRYELAEPSLEEIFIQIAGRTSADA